MGELVNLNRARKAKTKVEKERAADQNRVLFGRTKAEKATAEAEKRLAEKMLDAHKRDL